MNRITSVHARAISGLKGASIGALAFALLHSTAALAQAAPDSSAQPPAAGPASSTASGEESQEVVITGFRQSLNAALNQKRDSVAAIDAIVAEDIGKFPTRILRNRCSVFRAWRSNAMAVKAALSPSVVYRVSSPQCASTACRR